MKYTIKNLRQEFPNEDACLDYFFRVKYPNAKGYYRVRGRKCYSHKTTRHQIHPLAGTIFHKSSTPLTLWFHAIFLFATSRNGVSAMELQRQIGVTYKTAWRMAYQIRKLMGDGKDMLKGVVEADETYIGGFRKKGYGGKGKTPVVGIVARGGQVRAKVMPRETHRILNHIRENVERGSAIMSDKFGVYKKVEKIGFGHGAVNHWKKEFVRGDIHTNTIEGFWSQLKRSLHGTYHYVSAKHLQSYVNEFAFRYSNRGTPVFGQILSRI